MENQENNFQFIINKISRTVLGGVLVAVTLLLMVVLILIYINKNNHLRVEEEGKIHLTPTQIESIRNIGEWEFLSVSDEELIDTVRHGFFGDDELVRIYYGTLRLGIDLRDSGEDWIDETKDTLLITLPPVQLLDENFIDEARTRSFFESGTWTSKDRESMYQRAQQVMRQRCLTEPNLKSAQQNASIQMHHFFKAMGFNHVTVQFRKTQQ